jgi:hypothetical protein
MRSRLYLSAPGYLHVNDVTRKSATTPDYSQLALREQPDHDPDRGSVAAIPLSRAA